MCPVLHQLHEITVCHKRWGSNWVLWGITWKPNALEKSFLLAALRPVLQDRIKWNGNESLISTHTYTLTTNTNTVYQINFEYTWEKFHKQHDHFCKATHEVNRSPRVFCETAPMFPTCQVIILHTCACLHAEKKMTKAQSSKQVTCNTSLKLLCSNLNTSKLELTFISGELSNNNEIPWRSFNWNRGNCSSGSRAGSLLIIR